MSPVPTLLALLLAVALQPVDWDPPSTSVGLPAAVRELVLPGGLLEVAPARPADPLVLRLVAASPHGDAWRYDLEWYGLEPGVHDLRDALRREDGGSLDDLPPLPVEVTSVLPPGQVLPADPEPAGAPDVGGYRALLIAAGVLWLAGLVWMVLSARRRRAAAADAALAERPRTLADRLRPLVARALAGDLSRAERASLELSLMTLWRQRLGLTDDAADAVARLREHPEAGPLLVALEDWLHRPDRPDDVDLSALLRPYRDLPADALAEPLPGDPA